MSRTRYDLILGLGTACSCTETIRKAGLQLLSFPFDWLTTTCVRPDETAHELQGRVRELRDGFSTWFGRDDFRYVPPILDNGKDVYICDRLRLIFNHDFPKGQPFDQAFPIVRDRYRRRADRLLEIIRGAKRVLLVRMDRPGQSAPTDVEDCRAARMELSRAFAPTAFDFFLFTYDKGRSFRDRIEEEVEPGFIRLAFDYRNYEPGRPDHQVDVRLTGSILARRFAVRDYRTPAERRKHLLSTVRKRWERWQRGLLRLINRIHPGNGHGNEKN